MTRRFRVELKGEDAKLGRVAAGDVARLILGVERALARQSAHALGRPAAETGRWESVIADAARIRLAAVEEGSVVPVLDLPDYGVDGLALEAQTLGEVALELLLDGISGTRPIERDVAAAMVDVARELDLGGRNDAIVFNHTNGGGRRVAIVDAPARARLAAMAARPPAEHGLAAVRGTLVAADFERWTARLRTPTGEAVAVTFSPELSDAIDQALRRPAELEGDVTYDPTTSAATSIHLRELHQDLELWGGPESGDYWQRQSLAAAADSGVAVPVAAASELYASGSPDGEDLDAFFAAISE